MTSIKVHHKDEDLTAYEFETPADMTATLVELTGAGFLGTMTSYQNGEELVWRLEIGQPGKESLYVYLDVEGHDPAMPTYAVYSATLNELTVHTDSDFDARFVKDQ